MTDKIKIECPHITRKLDIKETVNDYYPLTKTEISKLLATAANNQGNLSLISEVQVRLNQGITGITCPRPITGKVANKLKELDNIFVKEYERGPSHDLVDKLYKIMTKK